MKLVKTLLENKEIEMPMDAAYYDRLHAKIMNGVEEAARRPRSPLRPSAWYEKPKSFLKTLVFTDSKHKQV
jgi:hypothetical protein